MAPIDVDPVTLAAGGVALAADGEALATALTTFSGTSKSFNAGQDTAGQVFAAAYTKDAAAVIKAALAAMQACRQVGFGIQMSAANYAAAEAAATISHPGPSVRAPVAATHPPVSVTIPNAYGNGIAAPLLWALVEHFLLGNLWPNGDPSAMRDAATAWKTLGEALGRVGTQIPTVKPSVSAQSIPEQPKIGSAVDDIASSVSGLAGMCVSIANELSDFAGKVEKAQNAIRDLLKRLSPSGLLDTIGDLFHGKSPLDEIKAVARDIRDVLSQLGREADANVQAIQQVVAALESLADAVENWISKEFPAIAPLVNAMIDFDVGAWKNIIGLVGAVAALNPERFFYDPQGALQAWKGTAEGLALMTNPALLAAKIATDPHGALEMGKSLVDWEDVEAGHPGRAVGYTATTIASFFIPGGAAAKPAALGAETGVRAAEAAAVETRAGSALTRDAAAMGRLPVADIATQTAKISEKLDNLPQVRPVEPARSGALEAPRPGASLTEQPRPTNTGLPSAEPRSQPALPSADPHPAGTPPAETRPAPADASAGQAAPTPVEHAPGTTPESGHQLHPDGHQPPPAEGAPGIDHQPAGSTPVPPDAGPPPPLPPDSPMFDGYTRHDPGTEFSNPDGSLIYPDARDPAQPYAIPGTVISDAEIAPGTILDRFGDPRGGWMSPDGVPFAERALPPDSASMPYYRYEVIDPAKLPPGWRIEQSQAAPWFHQPGGGTQYRIIAPPGVRPSVQALIDSGYLERLVR